MKEALETVEICVLCAWMSETPYNLAVSYSELYFVRCCALKRTRLENTHRKARLL